MKYELGHSNQLCDFSVKGSSFLEDERRVGSVEMCYNVGVLGHLDEEEQKNF